MKTFTSFGFSIREINFIVDVLNHKDSWNVPFKYVKEPKYTDIIIYKIRNTHINELFKHYPHLKGLSVCDSRSKPIKIYFSEENWNTVPQSSGYKQLNMYRTYVILHEFGHALGHGHENCETYGGPAPVMMQQTLGTGKCFPDPWVKKNF
jgi:hypothetical protein